MKNFNISKQSPNSLQAWKREYIQRLQQEVNSLYYYLHYYNPSWSLITDTQRYIGYSPYNSEDVYRDDALNDIKNYMDVSNIDWSYPQMDAWLKTRKHKDLDGNVIYTLYFETSQPDSQEAVVNDVFTSIYLPAGTYFISDENGYYIDYDEYLSTDSDYPIACIKVGNTYYGFGTIHKKITIPENGRYDITINFPHNTSPYEEDEMWLCITEKDVGFVPYGTPVAPTSKGIYRQALGFRWGVKNNTSEPQYINYDSNGTYKRLNPGATLFKIDASDDYGWRHYMIFEGSLAQYFTQKYSFDYNQSTNKMDVVITNTLINAATKGLSYSTQFSRVPPRYYYKDLSLIPLLYINNTAAEHVIYDNNNRITDNSQTIIQEWADNSDICIDALVNVDNSDKNLCIAADVSERIINGVTWRVENQVYYLNGTPTAGSWQHPNQPIVHLEPGTYVVYYYTNSTDPDVYTHIGYGLCDKNNPDVNMWYRLNSKKKRTFTISAPMDCYIIFWWGPAALPNGKTFDNVWVRTAVYNTSSYEPLFADVILATENESTQQFKAYLDKTQSEKKSPENSFKIIVY